MAEKDNNQEMETNVAPKVKKYFGKDLMVKATLITLLLSLLAMGAFYVLESNYWHQVLRATTRVEMGFLKTMAADAMIIEDEDILKDLAIQVAKTRNDIHSIYIQNEVGKNLAVWVSPNADEDKNIQTYVEDVVVSGELFGRIVFKENLDKTSQIIYGHLRNIGLLLLVCLWLLSTVIFAWIKKSVIFPLNLLLTSVSNVKEHVNEKHQLIKKYPQFKELIHSLGEFVGTAESIQHELEEHAQEFDETIHHAEEEFEANEAKQQEVKKRAEAEEEAEKVNKANKKEQQQEDIAAALKELENDSSIPEAKAEPEPEEAASSESKEQATEVKSDENDNQKEKSESEPETPKQVFKILMIDDEKDPITLMTQSVEALNGELEAVEDPEEGLALYKEKNQEIDLAVLPFVILEMLEETENFFNAFRAINEQIPIIFTTGSMEKFVVPEYLKDKPKIKFVEKPFNEEKFSEQIKEIFKELEFDQVIENKMAEATKKIAEKTATDNAAKIEGKKEAEKVKEEKTESKTAEAASEKSEEKAVKPEEKVVAEAKAEEKAETKADDKSKQDGKETKSEETTGEEKQASETENPTQQEASAVDIPDNPSNTDGIVKMKVPPDPPRKNNEDESVQPGV